MNSDLKKLYQQVIMKHNAQPFHFEKKEEASLDLEANNPLCGDQFHLYLEIEDAQIKMAYFYGFGCAISKASTSILTQSVIGKSIEEAKVFCTRFLDYIEGENRAAEQPADFLAFAAVDEFPARKECAILAWQALNKYLNEA